MSRAGGSARLWVFDFDGTLSPLVPDRNAAQLHPASRALLKALAGDPGSRVAVLSSRSIEDLAGRIPVRNLFLGGGSGLEWRFPAGHRIGPGEAAEARRDKARGAVLPLLSKISSVPGVEIEDKRWSLAVHFRRVPPEGLGAVHSLVLELERLSVIRVFSGPAAAEVQLLPSADKSFGVRKLCGFLRFSPSGGRIFYAGDDENDAAAMRWVIAMKGKAVAVGNGIRMTGVRHVDGPASLAHAVRAMACLGRRAVPASEGRSEG
ncbi:MAG: trehalose-phosphatase [Deltaproteobacteria bacterium]